MPKKPAILFIDDELEIIEGYRDFFENFFEMVSVESAQKALALMAKREFTVIIVDMRMEGIDGAAFLTIANQKFRKPIKVVLSGYVDEFFDATFQTRFRPYAVVRKPLLAPHEILRVVQDAAQEYEYRYGAGEKELNRYLTAQDTLERLSVSKPTLYKFLKKGLPSKRVGGRRLFDWREVTRWVQKQSSAGRKHQPKAKGEADDGTPSRPRNE